MSDRRSDGPPRRGRPRARTWPGRCCWSAVGVLFARSQSAEPPVVTCFYCNKTVMKCGETSVFVTDRPDSVTTSSMRSQFSNPPQCAAKRLVAPPVQYVLRRLIFHSTRGPGHCRSSAAGPHRRGRAQPLPSREQLDRDKADTISTRSPIQPATLAVCTDRQTHAVSTVLWPDSRLHQPAGQCPP